MKVLSLSRPEFKLDSYDWRNGYEIKIEGMESNGRLAFYDGEPEDANLARDFSDVYGIVRLMRYAYEAGKRGEEFIVEEGELDED